MGYRRCTTKGCPNRGWLSTSEYTVDKHGETICPECENPTEGFQMEEPNRR